ncbi:MAG: AAA family ATPase [Bacteroidia bacterium]
MVIKNIRIKNFKGFADEQFGFNPQFNVLIGDNGTGKSSILDALSIAMGTFLMRTQASFGYNGRKNRPLFKNEIRKIMVSPDNIEDSDVELSGIFGFNEQEIPWKRTQKRTSKSLSYGESQKLISLGEKLVEEIDKEVDLPLLVYHSTARLSGEIFEKTSYEKIGSRLDGYYACLDPRSINQKFTSWFKTFEDSALKFNKNKTLYNAFTGAITSVVPEWADIKFDWGLDDMVGKGEDGKWLPLANLSDGFRSTIGLVADIAYRAIKLNPHLGSRVISDTKGIVLIDELDMHLHPKWQKKIVLDLKNTFPKLQFITTTHSPFIVQSLKANEVINLDENKIDQHPDSLSLEQNALFMGVESKNSNNFFNKEKTAIDYLEILEGNPTEEELSKLDELIENSTDPVFKAKMKFEKLARFGKR